MKQIEPNFLVIGAAASGTSYLSEILVKLPGVYLPLEMRPEPHFFYKSWEYARGKSYYLDRWFANVPEDAIAVGERSSSYLFGGAQVAERIYLQNPSMRLIAVLRNPIERAWGNYRYTALEGLESVGFFDALTSEKERVINQKGQWAEIQPYNYTGRGFYAQQIEEFLRFFPQEQMLFLKSENLGTKSDLQLQKVLKFLGVAVQSQVFPPALPHTSVDVIDPALQMFIRSELGEKFDLLVEATRRNELESFLELNKIENSISRMFISNLKSGKTPMPEACRTLLQQTYEEDIRKLQQYVDFDLSDWV